MARTLALAGVGALVLSLAACGAGKLEAGTAGSNLDAQTGDITGGKCPGGNTVQGIDVSEFQGGINWGAVKASGMQFAIARVGDGSYQDPTFAGNWSAMKSAGLIRGAYQFFEPGEDATAQANDVINKVGRLGVGDLPVMLDMEVTGGQSAATITAKIHTWVDAITAGTGKRPFIYTGAYFWDDNVKSGDFSSLALDVAWYGTNCPGVPNAWAGSGWTFHQFTSTGRVSGIGGNVDVDLFNGSLAQLQAFAGGGSGSAGNSLRAVAFQANTTDLWTVINGGATDWKLGMMPGTSPAICVLPNGGYEVAFQANTGDLWTVGTAGNTDWKLGMMRGSSPAITALASGGFEVAFEANTTDLWTVGNAGNQDWKLGMMSGTSPSIAGLPGGGFEVAFEANTTDLWTVGNAGNQDWKLGMMAGSNPSIAALANGGFEVAFEANTTDLWTVGNAGNTDWKLGMMSGTAPSIVALPGSGFEVSFEANTTDLWTVGNAGNTDWKLGMYNGTNPAGG